MAAAAGWPWHGADMAVASCCSLFYSHFSFPVILVVGGASPQLPQTGHETDTALELLLVPLPNRFPHYSFVSFFW